MQTGEARWRASVRSIIFIYHSSEVLDIACSAEIANTVAWQSRGRDEDPAGEEYEIPPQVADQPLPRRAA